MLEFALDLPAPDELLVGLLDFVVEFHFLVDDIGGIEGLTVFIHPVVLLLYCLLLSLYMQSNVRLSASWSYSYLALAI